MKEIKEEEKAQPTATTRAKLLSTAVLLFLLLFCMLILPKHDVTAAIINRRRGRKCDPTTEGQLPQNFRSETLMAPPHLSSYSSLGRRGGLFWSWFEGHLDKTN